MFIIKLVSYVTNGELVEVHQTNDYRYEPGDNRGDILLSFTAIGFEHPWDFLLRYGEGNYNRAFVMNDMGKTIEIIKTYPPEE